MCIGTCRWMDNPKTYFFWLHLLDAQWHKNKNLLKHTHTHPFNGPFSGTTQVSQYQKGKTNLDFTEARDSEWQWHQQICKSASRSRQITTPVPHHSSFLQAGCPSCRPTNSVKALKAEHEYTLSQKTTHSIF